MSSKRKKIHGSTEATKDASKSKASRFRREYDRACQLGVSGDSESARVAYEGLKGQVSDCRLKALILNDLAALSLMNGAKEAAYRRFQEALEMDSECEAALANSALLARQYDAILDESRIRSSANSGAGTTRKTRVAILSFLFNWPSTGGGIIHTVELARFLGKFGYDVRHVFARFDLWGIGCVQDELPYAHETLVFDYASWNVANVQARFRRAMEAFQPDHIIITDSWNMKPLLAAAVQGYPYILRLQAMECLCPLNNLRLLSDEAGAFRQCTLNQLSAAKECATCVGKRGRQAGSLHQAEREFCGVGTQAYDDCLRRAFEHAEAVLVVNPLTEAMISPYSRRVRVVTSGMDPDRFPWPQPDNGQHATSGVGKLTLLFAGLVDEPIKGFAVLQQACSLLWRHRRDFELIATAEPVGQENEFTRFVGWLSQEDLPQHLRAADLLVVPTIAQEALGRTAVEAMAAGRPVVASRLGGLPFTVIDGATGLLFEPGNPEDLAQKIGNLLDDDNLRRRMGLAGRKRFEEHYSWDVIIERHYKPLLGETSQRASPSKTPTAP